MFITFKFVELSVLEVDTNNHFVFLVLFYVSLWCNDTLHKSYNDDILLLNEYYIIIKT